MESQDNLKDALVKSRPVLTDVTNRLPKRPFSSISRDGGDARFAKQPCLRVEDSVQNKSQPKGKTPYFTFPFCSTVSSQNPNSPNDGIHEQIPMGSTGCSATSESSVGLREIAEARHQTERLIANATQNQDKELLGIEDLGSLKSAAVEVPTIFTSRDSRFIRLERCAGLKSDGGGTSSVVAEEHLKTCSCSFCTKAGYMLSDLYYQDAKGRVSALRKSQKEASAIVQKLPVIKDSVTVDLQSSDASEIEVSLMRQWKSLFSHMENTFAQESSQLESRFETLKILRENCKNELELTKNSQCDNQ